MSESKVKIGDFAAPEEWPNESIDGDWVEVGPSWGNGWSEAEEEALCRRANDWLNEHEGPNVSISFRPIQRIGEAAGTYRDHGGRLQVHGGRMSVPETISVLISRAMEHACRAGPYRTYTVQFEDGEEEELEALDDDDANRRAESMVRECWKIYGRTAWVDVKITDQDGAWEEVTVEVDPVEPECIRDDGHEWDRPYSVLGGIEDNPGVQAKDGGVVIREVCAHCGSYKILDTWAQRPDNGVQGLRSISYLDPDDLSIQWINSRDD